MAWDTYKVNISEIKVGDTIIHNGMIKTVGANNIKPGDFLGPTLFGDSYNSGHKLVTIINYARR